MVVYVEKTQMVAEESSEWWCLAIQHVCGLGFRRGGLSFHPGRYTSCETPLSCTSTPTVPGIVKGNGSITSVVEAMLSSGESSS